MDDSESSDIDKNEATPVDSKAYEESSRIVFANPEDWMVQQFLSLLIRAEYKTVALRNHHHLLPALRKYKSSIIFFNIEKQPEEGSWYQLVKENQTLFMQQRSLPVFIGKDTRDHIKSKVDLEIPFDAFDMGRSPQQIFTLMQALIKQWYSRGKRQYIRVRCVDPAKSRFNLRLYGDTYQGTILDVSSAGMACQFDPGAQPDGIKKGMVLEKIQLKLNSRLVMVDGVIMGSRIDGNGEKPPLWVLVFRNHSDTGAVQKIKAYVGERLQQDFDESMLYA
jgi:hypothetical protein